jgi:hypothetical protein
MGLAIAEAIVGDLGGEVRHERLGATTVFTVTLPAATVDRTGPVLPGAGDDVIDLRSGNGRVVDHTSTDWDAARASDHATPNPAAAEPPQGDQGHGPKVTPSI